MTLNATDLNFVDGFLNDLRNMSNEGGRKHSAVKEASETAIIRLRNLSVNGQDVRESIVSHCLDLLQPILLVADSDNSKLVILGLQALQRLFTHETIPDTSLPVIMSLMWTLMENHVEELKLIQTITIILTSSNILHGEYLAKSLVICLRMHFSKDPIVSSTAGAAIRQLVPLLFEKALEESRLESPNSDDVSRFDLQRVGGFSVPATLGRCGADTFSLLQDLCLVINGEPPAWLVGLTEMTRVLALELMESVLLASRRLFDNKEFSYLLRERLCPLLIKLISPWVRSCSDKPSPFPLAVLVMRIVHVLLTAYCDLLRPECGEFYALLMKCVLDPEVKVSWPKLLAMEVFFKLLSDPKMADLISQTYSTKAASEGVFGDMINTMNNYILSVFVKSTSPAASPATTPSTPQPGGMPSLSSPTFTYKDVSIQLVPLGQLALLEPRDTEPPPASDNYGISLAFSGLCSASRTLMELQDSLAAHGDENKTDALQKSVQHSWNGMLSAVSTLLEASCDDSVTNSLVQICKVYVRLAGSAKLDIVVEAFLTALSEAAFSVNHSTVIVKAPSSHVTSLRPDAAGLKSNGETPDLKNRNQIAPGGTPLSASFHGPAMLTVKSATCLNALLDIATTLGDLLNSSWTLVLTSLQRLSSILGMHQLIPGALNGLSKQRQLTAEAVQNPIHANGNVPEPPDFSKHLDDFFRHTRNLSDASLEQLVSALCKLSQDAINAAAANRVAGSSHPVFRERGTDAIGTLVKQGLAFNFQPPLHLNAELTEKIIHPLLCLSRQRPLSPRSEEIASGSVKSTDTPRSSHGDNLHAETAAAPPPTDQPTTTSSPMGPRNLPLDQQTLTRLLSALTPAETELFDDLMDALVNVITNDLLTEEMSEGHRPTEPTPAEIDLMTNTWEDLFQNPFEYMLHSLESCPNCGRMIALSRMAPHIVSGCGKTTRTDGKKKRRKDGGGGGEGPPVRQTRSAAAVPTKKIPHTSALHTDGLFTSSSSSSQDGPPASQDSIQSAPVVAEFKPDPKRMSGLEHEIVRLKRRASTEGGPAVTTHPQLTGGSGVEISPETPSTSRL